MAFAVKAPPDPFTVVLKAGNWIWEWDLGMRLDTQCSYHFPTCSLCACFLLSAVCPVTKTYAAFVGLVYQNFPEGNPFM